MRFRPARRPLAAIVAVVCATVLVASCNSKPATDSQNATGEVAADESTPSTTVGGPIGDLCSGPNGVGTPVPAGAKPGDLVNSVAYPSTDSSGAAVAGYPSGAVVTRILYVSSGADETDLQLVCGTVTIPTAGPKTTPDGRTRVYAWAHGTVGLEEQCQPSANPDAQIWGKMPGGIQAVAWGSGVSARNGLPQNGELQYAVDQGWIVSTTDYQPNDTYVLGRLAGANVLDSVRAARDLVAQQFPQLATAPSDLVINGHSQGGHSALWAGQLADPYYGATGTTPEEIRLRGVQALAPASNFVAQPELQPGTQFGDGLADQEMHQGYVVIPYVSSEDLQIGPALFSFIFGSWSEFSADNTPAAGAVTPVGPPTGPLDITKIATAQGVDTIKAVMPLCLTGSDALTVKKIVAPYRDAKTNQMLVSSVWNLPASYKTGQYFKGGVDQTCATDAASLGGWCDWIRWNMPGPLGTNPFPKVPTSGGAPVPLLIAQGTNDTVIHCVATSGQPTNQVPAVSDCMSTALYESLKPTYCPDGAQGTMLQFRAFNKGTNSPATHFSIPGQMATQKLSSSGKDLVFTGSPTQQFLQGAFDGTLPTTCDTAVLNP